MSSVVPNVGTDVTTTDFEKYLRNQRGVLSGLGCAKKVGANTIVTVSGGVGMAGGYVYSIVETDVWLPPANGVQYVYVYPTMDSGGYVNGVQIGKSQSVQNSANRLTLCKVTIAGGIITSVENTDDNYGQLLSGANTCIAYRDTRGAGGNTALYIENGRVYGYTETVELALSDLSSVVGTGVRDYIDMPHKGMISDISLRAYTAPGGDFIVDVKKNGGSILDNNKVRLTSGQTTGSLATITNDTFSMNDRYTFEVMTPHASLRGLKILFSIKYLE